MFKREIGVMVMKDGLAWGKVYEDGRSTEYGWINPADAKIYDSKFCTNTTDVTYQGSYLIDELKKGVLVHVERITQVNILKT